MEVCSHTAVGSTHRFRLHVLTTRLLPESSFAVGGSGRYKCFVLKDVSVGADIVLCRPRAPRS